jgi:multisubunit Na+/H+ antiporter MnhB subunit
MMTDVDSAEDGKAPTGPATLNAALQQAPITTKEDIQREKDQLFFVLSIWMLLTVIFVAALVMITVASGLAPYSGYAVYTMYHGLYAISPCLFAYIVYDTLQVAYYQRHIPRRGYVVMYSLLHGVFLLCDAAYILYAFLARNEPNSLWKSSISFFVLSIAASIIFLLLHGLLMFFAYLLHRVQLSLTLSKRSIALVEQGAGTVGGSGSGPIKSGSGVNHNETFLRRADLDSDVYLLGQLDSRQRLRGGGAASRGVGIGSGSRGFEALVDGIASIGSRSSRAASEFAPLQSNIIRSNKTSATALGKNM